MAHIEFLSEFLGVRAIEKTLDRMHATIRSPRADIGATRALDLNAPIMLISESSRVRNMVRLTQDTGKSKEDAIIILEASDSLQGIEAEYTYLENTYGRRDKDWRLLRQSLIHSGAKHYDEMKILLATGETVVIYFDITGFYGRF